MGSVVAAGVDAAKSGWVAVVVGAAGFVRAEAAPTFDTLMVRLADVGAVAVDIPIGLPERRPRAADREARRFVGPRRSSVFAVPPRLVLEASDYTTARQVSRTRFATGVTAQGYALAQKIFEVERWAAGDRRLVEAHPEASFRAMAQTPLPHPKTTWNGAETRRALLADHGITLPADLSGAGDAAPHDVLDAAAAAWTALRKAIGVACSLPDPPERLVGRDVAIWY